MGLLLTLLRDIRYNYIKVVDMKKKTFMIMIILLIITIIPRNVLAESLQDMYNQLADLQAKANSNSESKNLTEKQIKELNTEISNNSASIENIRKEIKTTTQKDTKRRRNEKEDYSSICSIDVGCIGDVGIYRLQR